MTQTDSDDKLEVRNWAARLATIVALFASLALAASAAPAAAAFEQVGTFAGSATPVSEEHFAEEVQLGGVGGMAVNYTGEGGVPKGTVYAAMQVTAETRVAMYRAKVGGGLEFREAWQVTEEEGFYKRCGPELGVNGEGKAEHPCAPQVGNDAGKVDVEVDQSSGEVFVYGGFSRPAGGEKEVVAFKADGSAVLARFGEQAPAGQSVAVSPEEIHSSSIPGMLAVTGTGTVYLSDKGAVSGSEYFRLMVFTPQGGGYEYAGETLAAAGFGSLLPTAPVTDGAGNLYVGGGASAGRIEEFTPPPPKPFPAPSASPICSFDYPSAGILGMTVDPETGEPFFYSNKPTVRVHRLSACNAEGEFTEEEVLAAPVPERSILSALAFDPVGEFPAGRPAGILYGASPQGKFGQTGTGSLGYVFAHPVEAPPQVSAESVAHVTPTTADLGAKVNPKGASARYTFQYETQAHYEASPPAERFAGAEEAPPGGALAGGGKEAITVAASLTGLQPDTAYRYRAFATSNCSTEDEEKVCEGTGEVQSFRTFPVEASGLPDHRAYELVSPVDKQGGQVLPAEPEIDSCPGESPCKPGSVAPHFPMQSAPDGNSIVYEGTPFTATEGQVNQDEYIARRDRVSGWHTTNLTPTLQGANVTSDGIRAFATDLGAGLLEQDGVPLSSEAPVGYVNLYAESTADPLALRPLLTTEAPSRPPTGTGRLELRYAGVSADLSHVFFAANDALTEGTPFAPAAMDGGPNKLNLYEWDEGQLRLVNVMPGNSTTQPGASFGAASAHAISEDGTRVFWSDESGQVYVREKAELTKAISTEGTPDPAKFLAAAVDGSKVLLQNGHLHYLGGEEPTIDLTQGQGGFQGLAGQTDDLSSVYFTDTAALTPGTEARTCEGAGPGTPQRKEEEEGKVPPGFGCNLYAYQEGTTSFIATLASQDNVLGAGRGDWSSPPSNRTAEASPDGRYLAFLSWAPLTGYNNTGICESNHAGGKVSAPCTEVFLYDSATQKLICASCNPSGESPPGHSTLRRIQGAEGFLPQPRYLSNSGRLFFDSQDSLSPRDTNDDVEDVYEYEPSGVGTCKHEGGCISLISPGAGVEDSNFLAADPSGENVFFTTRDQLTQKDKDEQIDLYDAREGGGIPSETEIARTECQGEACQRQVPVPNDPTPGSSSFEGAGNASEPAAKKHKKKHTKKRHKAGKRVHGLPNNNRGGTK